jgi:hypothetical protein
VAQPGGVSERARKLDYRLIKELWAHDRHASPSASTSLSARSR